MTLGRREAETINHFFPSVRIQLRTSVLKRYEPTDKMSDVEADIQREVNPVLSNMMARRYPDEQPEAKPRDVSKVKYIK